MGGRYVEYGLAEKGGIGVAALKNNAGAFVTPWQANITRMANEIALPPSAASAQWEHVNFLSLGAPGLWVAQSMDACAVLAEDLFVFIIVICALIRHAESRAGHTAC